MTARRRSKRMVLCPHCQTACAVYVAVYPHTRGTTAYCETHGWLHCYDPRRMASAQVHTERQLLNDRADHTEVGQPSGGRPPW